MNDEYRTLDGPCEVLFKAKGSKHFGYGFPIESEEEAKERLQEIRKAHHAPGTWRTLGCSGTMRHNTDARRRRTSNSAGPPILGVIRANDLTKVLFAVVRYFGAPNLALVDSLKLPRGAAEALRHGTVVQRIRTERIQVAFAYEHMGTIMGLVKRLGPNPPPPISPWRVRWSWTFACRPCPKQFVRLKKPVWQR